MIIVDVLKSASDIGLPIRTYRYLGMGANRFYDFVLMHKYVGIKNMISLEHDPKMFERAKFNVPFGFIDVQSTSVSTFVAADSYVDPTVAWLDYDGGVGPHIIRDITDIGVKTKVGDFLFLTVFGGPPKVLQAKNQEERLAWLQDNLGAVAGEVAFDDVETSSFPDAVIKILRSALQNAFAARRDGHFSILMQVEYSDSSPMVTIGGAFLASGQAAPLKDKMKLHLPFLKPEQDQTYQIRSLHLTEREKALFDRATTKKKTSSERKTALALGFRDKDFQAYEDLIRFLPRYVEAIV
jgi:hypothetical protein